MYTSFILSFKIVQTFAAFRHLYSAPKICSNHFVIYESCFLFHQSIMYAHELMCLKCHQSSMNGFVLCNQSALHS